MSRDRVLFNYIRELLSRLDAEHSHQDPCDTCAWLDQQPEWNAMKEKQEETP